MNNQQVAHLWANQAKPSAHGSNFYFTGRALYSYGGHFCVGRIVQNKCGQRAFLLNADSYSMSTSRHQYHARRAIESGSVIFYVSGASEYHNDNRRRYKSQAAAAMARIPSCRKGDTLRRALSSAANSIEQYNSYSAFFALHGRLEAPRMAPADAARMARYYLAEAKRAAEWAAKAPERAAREAERETAKLQEAAERDAQKRADFRNGAPRAFNIGGPCMLRLNGETFETSHGADVPRAEGIAMLGIIARLISGKQELSARDQYTAGGFTLRGIEGDNVRIGCHVIPLSECAAMAALVGVEWPS